MMSVRDKDDDVVMQGVDGGDGEKDQVSSPPFNPRPGDFRFRNRAFIT
jgi:hypothetical protein